MTGKEVSAARLLLGWSRDHLARAGNVPVGSVYLFERSGSAGQDDDQRIVDTLQVAIGQWIGAASPVFQPSAAAIEPAVMPPPLGQTAVDGVTIGGGGCLVDDIGC